MIEAKVAPPQHIFIEVDGLSFFLDGRRFFLTADDALKFGAGLVNASLEKKAIVVPTVEA